MRWLLSVAVLPALAAGADDLVDRVRRRTSENLSRLPNYTCRMTVGREARESGRKKWQPVDLLRFDVAYVGGRELFAWPGKQFEEKHITDMVTTGGMIGSGDFAMHARSVLVEGRATLTCRAEASTVECAYRVPLARSGYVLQLAGFRGPVGYSGAIVFEAKTLDLRRFTVAIDEVPPGVGLTNAGTVLEYANVEIGGSQFVLPRSSDLVMVDADGYQTRNHIRFDSCRQYTGESTISFADPVDVPEQAKTQAVQLPPGIALECALRTRLSEETAIGDPVRAVVLRDVRRGRETLLPKGVELVGRLTRMQRVLHSPSFEYWVVGVAFDAAEGPNLKGVFAGDLQQVGISRSHFHVPFASDPGAGLTIWNSVRNHPDPKPGESIFYVRGTALRTGELRMIWRTR